MSDLSVIIELCMNTPYGFKIPELYINESVAYMINEFGNHEFVDYEIIMNEIDRNSENHKFKK